MKSIAIICCIFKLKTIATESVPKNDRQNVLRTGVVLYPDVIVHRQVGSESQSSPSPSSVSEQVTRLPLGSFVLVGEQSSGNNIAEIASKSSSSSSSKEWVHVQFPVQGWIPLSSLQITSTEPISSLALWKDLPELYSAGQSVMGTRKLSTSWLDQWPIGTGKIGMQCGFDVNRTH